MPTGQQQLISFERTESEEFEVSYEPIHVSKSTFKAGLGEQVHRWFRLTPSFGCDLVEEMLTTLGSGPEDRVLDPFCGAATTVIESQLNGIASVGIEINPLLQFVGATSLDWTVEPEVIGRHLHDVESEFLRARSQQQFEPPPIHDPYRWWRRDVLHDLMALRTTLMAVTSGKYRAFLELALAGVLVPDLTNVTLGRLQLHFVDRSADAIDVWSTFRTRVELMTRDLEKVRSQQTHTLSRVVLGDSTERHTYESLGRFNRVITSPPYPNRYSYVWNTRPHLYMLGFFDHAKQASALDLKTIGGTWGTATSVLMKGAVIPSNSAVADVVADADRAVRQLDPLMANYMVKYFNLLAQQILAMDSSLSANTKVAYVVGCSRLKGVFVETDRLLARLFEKLDLGYRVDLIHRFRKRHSDKELFESVVYASKA